MGYFLNYLYLYIIITLYLKILFLKKISIQTTRISRFILVFDHSSLFFFICGLVENLERKFVYTNLYIRGW